MLGRPPLYNVMIPGSLGTGHAGLWFDKFVPEFVPTREDKKSPKFEWLDKFLASSSQVGDGALIAEFVARRTQLIAKMGGLSLSIKTAERLVTGLGYRHPLENGFAWHATLGTPYLPGSGLKGLARAYATFCNQSDVERIFGPRGDGKAHQIGSVVFLEGIPTNRVKLVAEVMTPHYGPYYQGNGDAAPADYHKPVPIPFLAVDKDVSFLAGVLPRRPKDVGDLEDTKRAHTWLCDALKDFGAGAKTATGFGRFEVE